MSSNEDEPNEVENSLQGLKKRRIQRACDICRRKKIRCDGVQMPGNRCSNCIAYNFECTYVEAAKKRGPPKGYVESLENRLEKMERLIRKLCPDEDILSDLDAVLESEPLRLKACAPPVSEVMGPRDPRDIATSVIRRVGSPLPPSDELHDEENEHIIIADNLKRLSIDPIDFRFFGKSSGAMLIQTAIELKNEYTGTTDSKRPILGSIRPEFWHPHLWERPATTHEPRRFEFPDEDLIHSLIDLYFKHVNLILPLLHRPTFEREIAEGLHYRNESFGATVLLACAVGSRFSDDPRVLLDGVDTFHSAGWKWFMQVQAIKSSLLAPPSLYDLQFHSLYVQFLQGTSTPQACWTMVGIGVRLAQDVGAHRQNSYSENTAAEGELRKRAVWVLICLDRMISAALGRPCAIHDEDYDLDMPIECDDEYWYHPDPEQCFKQPPGKPSLVSAFVSFIKLNQVLAFTLRTIYSINKSKILLGFVGQQWEQHIVAELDSALNKWVDSLPDHLRWDPNRENINFFTQSAVLYSIYYHIQILVHRPFIPSPRRPSTLSFPSLAICTNAARACSHVIDIQRKRGGLTTPQIQMVVFTAGIVLLLNIWGGKRSGLTTDPNREMADVHKCMQALKGSEHKWISVGRLWDILYELAFVGDLPLPKASPPASNKRDRGAESPRSSTPIATTPMVQDGPRSYAGPKRVSSIPSVQIATQPPPPPSTTQAQNQQQPRSRVTFSLPVYSNELGRLPLHGQSMFTHEQSSSSASSLSASDLGYWYPTPASSNVLTPNVMGQMPSEASTSASSYGSNAIPSVFTMPSGASVMSYDQSGLNIPSHAQSSSSTSASISMGAAAGSAGQLPSAPFGFDLDPQIDVQQQQIDPSALERFVPTSADPLDLIDSDTIAMWSSAPTGFELDDWGTYLSNVSELTHGMHHTSEFHPGQLQH